MIALSDRVFGWDSRLRRPLRRVARGDPRRSVALRRGRRPRRSGTSSRSATRPSRASGRCRSRSCPPSSGRRQAVPGADHRLAARRGDPLRARLVPDRRPRALRRPRSRRGARRRARRRGATTSSSTRSATGTRSCRRATRTPGSRRRAGTASYRWPRSFLWIARRGGRARDPAAARIRADPRARGVARSSSLVHALSQAPQSEFELPFVPVWIVAALVGLLAPRSDAP